MCEVCSGFQHAVFKAREGVTVTSEGLTARRGDSGTLCVIPLLETSCVVAYLKKMWSCLSSASVSQDNQESSFTCVNLSNIECPLLTVSFGLECKISRWLSISWVSANKQHRSDLNFFLRLKGSLIDGYWFKHRLPLFLADKCWVQVYLDLSFITSSHMRQSLLSWKFLKSFLSCMVTEGQIAHILELATQRAAEL